jgi:1-acyl-sn-glycerol-3-phosphate acyltransferase
VVGALLRFLGLSLVRLFYPTIAVSHRERLPDGTPVLLLANHPNGLLDPLVLRLALGRPVGFLAKSTLFSNPAGRAAMDAFGALPVYRPKDGQDTSKNEATFAACRRALAEGRWLAMFPEGTSHSDPKLKPLKTGAARIALGAEEEHRFELGLSIVPVGLLYEDKDIFRSAAAVAIGTPIRVADHRPAEGAEPRAAVDALTEAIQRGLAEQVLEAETSELWRGFLAVAGWTAGGDLAAREEHARRLAKAYRELLTEDPDRAVELERATRRFVRVLRAVGVPNPLSLEEDAVPSGGRLLRTWLSTLLLLPFAAIGALLGWLPYRLVRPAAIALAHGEPDLIGTLKALLGVVVLGATYFLEAGLVAHLFGPGFGLAMMFLGPASGYLALRFDERLSLRKDALRAWWLRAGHQRIAELVVER